MRYIFRTVFKNKLIIQAEFKDPDFNDLIDGTFRAYWQRPGGLQDVFPMLGIEEQESVILVLAAAVDKYFEGA